MRVMMSTRRSVEVHVRRAVKMRHVSCSGSSMMMIARSCAPGGETCRRRRCRVRVMSYQTVDHSGVGMVKATTMVMSRGGGGKHSGGVARRVAVMWRRAQHASGAVGKLERRQGIRPWDPLMVMVIPGWKELRKGI